MRLRWRQLEKLGRKMRFYEGHISASDKPIWPWLQAVRELEASNLRLAHPLTSPSDLGRPARLLDPRPKARGVGQPFAPDVDALFVSAKQDAKGEDELQETQCFRDETSSDGQEACLGFNSV